MSVTCTPREGEAGSVRRVGAGYGVQAFDLTASGGSTTHTLPTIFTEIESVDFRPQTPAGAVGSWALNATDKQSADLTFTANFVGQVYVTGRGM